MRLCRLSRREPATYDRTGAHTRYASGTGSWASVAAAEAGYRHAARHQVWADLIRPAPPPEPASAVAMEEPTAVLPTVPLRPSLHATVARLWRVPAGARHRR